MKILKHHSLLLLLLLIFPLHNYKLKAQVTIGSGTAPHKDALLDLKEDSDGFSNKGLLLPRVTLSATTNPSPLSEHVEGMTVYNIAKTGDVSPGYYYNNGTKWVILGSSGNSGSNSWQVAGTSNSASLNTDNIYQMGSVAVGYKGSADPSAIFNVQSTDKGVLLPKVTLRSATDRTTIANPTQGLLVYNTGTNANLPVAGYMFWDGTQWKVFGSNTSKPATATLNPKGATMSPDQKITTTPIITGSVMQIPYTNSNGGYIKGVIIQSATNPNVKITISDGMLTEGNGVLNFALSGTPSSGEIESNTFIFDLTNFLNANPGISSSIAVFVRGKMVSSASEETNTVMGYLSLASDMANWELKCDSPDGKFSVRVRVPSNLGSIKWGSQDLNIQIRNNENSSVNAIWNAMYDYGNTSPFGASGIMTIPSKQWGGATHTSATPTPWGNIWGQIGIYDATGSGPEYRRYTWIPMGNNKVAYEITVMAALDTMTPTVAVHPTQVKAYIRLQQITAM